MIERRSQFVMASAFMMLYLATRIIKLRLMFYEAAIVLDCASLCFDNIQFPLNALICHALYYLHIGLLEAAVISRLLLINYQKRTFKRPSDQRHCMWETVAIKNKQRKCARVMPNLSIGLIERERNESKKSYN